MANRNLPKEATAVNTGKAERTKKETKKPVEALTTPARDSAKANSSRKKIKVQATIAAKRPSMVDAALRILGAAKKPMSCKELVEAMTTKGLWSSPNGRTPANTLYSSFLRLIQNKGKAAPIRKADKGMFAINFSATA
jgi:hypothetical protein